MPTNLNLLSFTVAAKAAEMNCSLNNAKNIHIDTRNLIGQINRSWDIVLLGDMFYDEHFTNTIADWMHKLHTNGTHVLIGDPGRVYFTRHKVREQLNKVFNVELPDQSKWENNGLTQGSVWKYTTS